MKEHALEQLLRCFITFRRFLAQSAAWQLRSLRGIFRSLLGLLIRIFCTNKHRLNTSEKTASEGSNRNLSSRGSVSGFALDDTQICASLLPNLLNTSPKDDLPLLPLHSTSSTTINMHPIQSPKIGENSPDDSDFVVVKSERSSRTLSVSPVAVNGESDPSNGTGSHSIEKTSILDRRGLSEEFDGFVAVTSYEYERYERNVKVEKHYWTEYIIDPLDTSFMRPEPPPRWDAYVHPDGGLYFCGQLELQQPVPVLTDMYIYEEEIFTNLTDRIQNIREYIETYNITLPADTCLVLELRQSKRWGYYFVDHTKKSLFWLDEFDAMTFLGEVRVAYTPSHVGYEMRSLYWLHNENFPEVRTLCEDDLLDLKDILIHAVGDSLTSPTHTAPYSLDILQKMLELVREVEGGSQPESRRRPGSLAVIYRLLHNFHHEHFLHLHGEKAVRLNSDQSIHPPRPRTWLITVLSPLCGYGPEVHLRKLQKMSVDNLVRKPDWVALLEELTDEWKEFTLYATVMLNANVAFLAIQSVDEAAPPDERTIAQRASYLSIATSVGAIVLGLLLVRLHNTTLKRDFLALRSASALGLEMLAMMYSLPYVLLMWGMLAFLVAFSAMCFTSKDIVTIIMISLGWPMLALILLWAISSAFENKPFWAPWPFRQLGFLTASEGKMMDSGRLRPRRVGSES